MSAVPVCSRRCVLVSVASLSVVLVVCSLMGTAAPEDDAKAIRGVLEAQVVAWNKGDLEGFMAGYWKSDKLFFISGGKTTEGFTPVHERYKKTYQSEGKEMGRLKFGEINVEMLGDSAGFVRGKWEVTTKAGKVEGWFTLVFRKLPEGWKIVHDHTSKE